MVDRTRKRIARICGAKAAKERVRAGIMEDLSDFPDNSFHLIVALGIYHQALSLEDWHTCISESARVLRESGLLLVSVFTPDSQPYGKPVVPVRNMPHMYEGFSSGPLCLFSAKEHDAEMNAHGFDPHAQTETVRAETEEGYRLTMNALYRKLGTSSNA
jgi:hypothetical protein